MLKRTGAEGGTEGGPTCGSAEVHVKVWPQDGFRRVAIPSPPDQQTVIGGRATGEGPSSRLSGAPDVYWSIVLVSSGTCPQMHIPYMPGCGCGRNLSIATDARDADVGLAFGADTTLRWTALWLTTGGGVW